MKKIFLLLTLLTLLVGCGPKTFNYGGMSNSFPELIVQAEGQVKAKPDQLQMRLGVLTEAETADAALEQNTQRMTAVMQMLKEIGIGADEMATGQFQIRPEWSRPPRPTPANWQRQIIGYQVTNELQVTTSQIALAGKLLSLAQRAGANQIGGLQFGLADPTTERQRAIEVATAKAIRKAQTMAAAAGVTLGELQSISLNGGNSGGMQPMMLAEARMASAEAAPVPVAAGSIDITAAVTLVYRLQQARVDN